MNTGSNLSNLSIKAGVTIDQMMTAIATSFADRAKGDQGQGVLEYAGVLLLVAAIVVAIGKLEIDKSLSGLINGAISDVTKAN